MPKTTFHRRQFLKTIGAGTLIGATTHASTAQGSSQSFPAKQFSANDKIRVAAIGMGIIGFENMNVLHNMSGVTFVAAADCYDGRLKRTQEVFGKGVSITRNYQELIEREDIDAVIINAPDHWHAKMAIDAMKAGKAAYIEKPIVQQIEDGHAIIEAQKQSKQVAIVGSKGFMQPLYRKAKSLIKAGAIGQLNAVESTVSRNSSMGAWQYTIPSDASEKTINWQGFLGNAPKRAFDADRFFRWRKYWDYGTGVSGDMFVHRLSGLHFMLDSLGPTQISACGGTRYWNDGREVPDILMALLDYPETATHPAFTLILKANFADGSGGGPSYRFIGSEGVMDIRGNKLTVKHAKRWIPNENSLVEGYNSVRTFAKDQREEFSKEYRAYKSATSTFDQYDLNGEQTFTSPSDYDQGLDHFGRFFSAMRKGTPIVQDPTFGLRAAAPSIIPNYCYLEQKVIKWDAKAMKIRT